MSWDRGKGYHPLLELFAVLGHVVHRSEERDPCERRSRPPHFVSRYHCRERVGAIRCSEREASSSWNQSPLSTPPAELRDVGPNLQDVRLAADIGHLLNRRGKNPEGEARGPPRHYQDGYEASPVDGVTGDGVPRWAGDL